MLERLSPISLKGFNAAKQRARHLKSSELSTGHLLLGLLEHREAWLTDLFRPHGVTTEQVRQALEHSLGEGTHAPAERLVVAAEIKSALKQEIDIARGMPVTPLHLLPAMLHVDQKLNALLERLGIDTGQILQALSSAQGGQQGTDTSTEPVEEPTTEEPDSSSPTDTGARAAELSVAAERPQEHKPTPTLDRYSRDLTRLAREGSLHPIIGRDREIAATIEILCRTIKRNPILVGEPGVGKTALAEGLAQHIIDGTVPPLLRGQRLVELSISSLVEGASQVGEFEKRLQHLVAEVQAAGDVILFIDEAHALMGAGGAYGLQDAATILKPALARGDIVCIGSTTTHEYRKYIEKDGALARRFQPVRIQEPERESVLRILGMLKSRFEGHFGIVIPQDLIGETYDLAKNYLKNRYFPDKAIDLLERAASRAMLSDKDDTTLTVDTMLSVLSDMTGIPLEKLDQGEMERYLRMEEVLRTRVIGQDQAIGSVAGLVRLTKRRLDLDPKRPDGVFLFVGPAGVGKTELAKALTEFLFGDEDRLIRLDMSEYSSEYAISRLIGSPPGYVGYDQAGQPTPMPSPALRRNPIWTGENREEKAHGETTYFGPAGS